MIFNAKLNSLAAVVLAACTSSVQASPVGDYDEITITHTTAMLTQTITRASPTTVTASIADAPDSAQGEQVQRKRQADSSNGNGSNAPHLHHHYPAVIQLGDAHRQRPFYLRDAYVRDGSDRNGDDGGNNGNDGADDLFDFLSFSLGSANHEGDNGTN
ncbi:hypothetical protein DAEQUDRAFT_756605 [Daedalea quercina L-15889]|uniref:Uncharacterized protein n=1 Tax=Daedalea quercina L-15889 TaxID=1314783 RepID=A0A165QU45_9APHY|nr:hypothetical protein DAEQUDRAFT_756605 [Daedalea quercina L-15889]